MCVCVWGGVPCALALLPAAAWLQASYVVGGGLKRSKSEASPPFSEPAHMWRHAALARWDLGGRVALLLVASGQERGEQSKFRS